MLWHVKMTNITVMKATQHAFTCQWSVMVSRNVWKKMMRTHAVRTLSIYHVLFLQTKLFAEKIAGDCGGIFKYKNGHLTSPAYPNLYPNRNHCIYQISHPNDTFIKLKILEFNLTFDTACNDDNLEIRDGITSESPLIGKFCGTDIPTIIVSSQNSIWLR